MSRLGFGLTLAVLVLGLGCPRDLEPEPDVEPDAEPEVVVTTPEASLSTKNQLLWKRYRALEQGLGEALTLPAGNICRELGRYDCVERVHLVALGGNDPFLQGMHEPMASPTTATPVAIERLVMSACDAAVVQDAARPVPLIFLELDLSVEGSSLDLADEATSLAIDDTVTSLFRRLHARDPQPDERDLVRRIVSDDAAGLNGRTFALLACYAVGTTSEMVFY